MGGITTKDLAQLCGVSRTTVHRALNNTGRINPETKEMILKIAKEHDYHPDLLARGLVKGQSFTIGVVVLDVKSRYFSQMLSIIGDTVREQGYFLNIVLHNNDKEVEKEQMRRLADYHVDGIILSSVNEGKKYKTYLDSLHTPIVTVDNKITEGIPFVSIDQRQALREATESVIEKGYEKLVFVCPPMESSKEQNMYVHKERLKGFEEVIKKYPKIEKTYLLDWNYLQNLRQTISTDKKTAFLCTADSFALDIMKKLKKDGLNVPKDYGIMGFDDIDILDYVTPKLSTISNEVEEVSKRTVEMLFRMIAAKNEGKVYENQSDIQMVPYEMIPGETL